MPSRPIDWSQIDTTGMDVVYRNLKAWILETTTYERLRTFWSLKELRELFSLQEILQTVPSDHCCIDKLPRELLTKLPTRDVQRIRELLRSENSTEPQS